MSESLQVVTNFLVHGSLQWLDDWDILSHWYGRWFFFLSTFRSHVDRVTGRWSYVRCTPPPNVDCPSLQGSRTPWEWSRATKAESEMSPVSLKRCYYKGTSRQEDLGSGLWVMLRYLLQLRGGNYLGRRPAWWQLSPNLLQLLTLIRPVLLAIRGLGRGRLESLSKHIFGYRKEIGKKKLSCFWKVPNGFWGKSYFGENN